MKHVAPFEELENQMCDFGPDYGVHANDKFDSKVGEKGTPEQITLSHPSRRALL